MKKLFLLLSCALLGLQGIGQGTDFRDLTLDQAIAAAKAENKYVFVDVYTDWCGPCKMMTAQIFPMKEVGEYFNKKFVCLQFNAEKGEEGPAFTKRFGIKAYPTFVILNSDNELLHMFAGGILNLSFIDKVEASFNTSKAFGMLKKRYDAGERDPKFVASYIEALQNTYTADVSGMIEEFYKSTNDRDKICPECLFMFDNYARVWSEKDDFLTANRDKFRKACGRDKVDVVFKNKYTAYYAQILQGYDRNATKESIEKTNGRLATLGLTDTGIFPIFQAAALVKLTGEGADIFFKMIQEKVPSLEDNDRNTVLYYVTIGLKTIFTHEQKDTLVALITNENTKGYVTRSINH